MPDIFIDQDPSTTDKPSEHLNENTTTSSETKNPEEIKIEFVNKLGLKPHDESRHVHLLSSYCENPPKVKFTNSLENEVLLLYLRRHFITNVPWMLKALALALFPIIIEIFSALELIPSDFITPSGKLIVYLFYYFFIFSGYVYVNFITWFYNISIVTNIRIIDIDFSQIVFENVAATKLAQVEDVSYSQIGVFRSMFDYGDVHIQTAGTASNFEFLAVPHPEDVIRIIHNLMGKKSHV